MNCESEIVDNILNSMASVLDDEQMKALKNVIRVQLCNYEIKQKETTLMCINGNGYNYLEKFKKSLLNSGRSPQTLENYDLHIRKFLSYIGKNVEDITDDDVIDYLDKYRKYRNISLVYMNDIRLVLNSFFNFLRKRRIIVYNPIDGVDPIKTKYVIKKPFTAEEMVKLRSSCTSLRNRAMIEFMYSTAVRVSELVALNIDDIQWSENEIIVLGKGNKERVVYLNPSARYYLSEYLNSRTDNCEALFVGSRKPFRRLTKEGVQEMCRKAGRDAGVQNVHPHRFRRTAATDLLRTGMPIEQVQEYLGHEKIDTTRIYCSVSRDQVKSSHKKYMVA